MFYTFCPFLLKTPVNPHRWEISPMCKTVRKGAEKGAETEQKPDRKVRNPGKTRGVWESSLSSGVDFGNHIYRSRPETLLRAEHCRMPEYQQCAER